MGSVRPVRRRRRDLAGRRRASCPPGNRGMGEAPSGLYPLAHRLGLGTAGPFAHPVPIRPLARPVPSLPVRMVPPRRPRCLRELGGTGPVARLAGSLGSSPPRSRLLLAHRHASRCRLGVNSLATNHAPRKDPIHRYCCASRAVASRRPSHVAQRRLTRVAAGEVMRSPSSSALRRSRRSIRRSAVGAPPTPCQSASAASESFPRQCAVARLRRPRDRRTGLPLSPSPTSAERVPTCKGRPA